MLEPVTDFKRSELRARDMNENEAGDPGLEQPNDGAAQQLTDRATARGSEGARERPIDRVS